MSFTSHDIDALRERIGEILSPFRMNHTLGVERMAVRLARIYCPEKELLLRAAALLHDVSKEKSLEEQVAIFKRNGIEPSEEQLSVPPTIHAYTAPFVIKEDFPKFAEEELLEAVRYHSTGRANMTLAEKIIFLSDYIEDTRKYEDCIALREEFFSAEPEKMSEKEGLEHLNRVLLHSLEITVADLREKGKIIEKGTLEAADSLRSELGIH